MKYTKKRKTTNGKTRSNKVNLKNNMIYEKHVFSKPDFETILRVCNSIPKNKMRLDEKASGRLMYTFNNSDPIHKLIYNKQFIEKVRSITRNPNLAPCLEIPIEYRIYEPGSYMDWHRDTKMLPDQNQYECVITLTNNSDSKSLFCKSKKNCKSISSEPNSIIIVQANGIMHKVTKTTRGRRTIIKLVFTTQPNNSITKPT